MLSNQTTPEIKVDTTGFIGPAYFDNEDGADVGKDKPPESRTHLKAYHLPGQAKDHPVALSTWLTITHASWQEAQEHAVYGLKPHH